jgi:hypothetical protein
VKNDLPVPSSVTIESTSFVRLVYSFDVKRPPNTEGGAPRVAVESQVITSLVDRICPKRCDADRSCSHRSEQCHPDRICSDRSGQCEYDWVDREIITPFLLPHLSRHLNVPRAESGALSEFEVAHWWTLGKKSLTENPAGHIPVNWRLDLGERSIAFSIQNIELALFRTFVGFLVIEISPDSNASEDFIDLAHHVRFYNMQQDAGARTSQVYSRRAKVISPIRPKPDGPEVSSTGMVGLAPLIHELVSDALDKTAWSAAHVPGRLTAYSALFARSEAEDPSREAFLLEYRWRRFLHSRSSVAATAHDDLQSNLVPYAQGMSFSYSLDGGGFFGINVPNDQFFLTELPEHIRRPYFFGFILACHQRLTLTAFSSSISDVWRDGDVKPSEIRDLEDTFLVYLASCSFIQVMQTANHHASHRKWLEVLEVEPFQREVESELDRLYKRMTIDEQIHRRADRDRDDDRTRHTERVVAAAGLAFAFPSLGLAAYALVEPNGTSWAKAIGAVLALAFFGLIAGIVATRPSLRSSTKRAIGSQPST